MRVFVAGGTGMIGTRLVRKLHQQQHAIVLLTRRPDAAKTALGEAASVVQGDPTVAGPWMDSVNDCDAVINLTGEGVFNKRWNDEFKKVLVDSRVRSTENVVAALARNPRRPDGSPKTLVNASAVGYYGPRGDEEIAEDSPPGNDFLARLCVDWEAAAHKVEASGVRLAIVRVGVVLGKYGGALAKLLTPFKMGAGGPVGSGKQWLPWIHHEDIVGLFVLALENPAAAGPMNGCAPNPVTNKEFSNALGQALHRPAVVWTPEFLLKLGLGEVAEVVTQGQRVLPKKALALGYAFKFPQIDDALKDAIK
jgi:uncharacterized protein (TIGR01777 family)